jgi:hypothetical protein
VDEKTPPTLMVCRPPVKRQHSTDSYNGLDMSASFHSTILSDRDHR